MKDLMDEKIQSIDTINWINNTAMFCDMSTAASKMFDAYLSGNEETKNDLVSALIFLYCLEKWKA